MDANPAPKLIGFILTPGYALMSLASAVEPLRAASHLAGRTLYRSSFYSVEGGFMPSTAGGGFNTAPLSTLERWENGAKLDLVFVVAGGNPMLYESPALMRSLRLLGHKHVRLGGISGGAAILARGGLLSGRRFTVHWAHIGPLAEFDPELLIERALYVIDRDRYTCAGGVAALDMMCALIAQEHGSTLARDVSDWFIHPRVRKADELQQGGAARTPDMPHPMLRAALDLMSSHLADPLSNGQVAGLVGGSERQLQRLFTIHFGMSMMAFYRDLRLAKADELLQQSTLSILEIAVLTGFASTAHLSRCFAARYGMPPGRRRKAKQPREA
ncbi:MAG TPA: GlxA family transcriptional regulator [Rhizobiaceae bacterium]|nr:GlxA family transcriptional regulator [Rhizobiaceae bacterium]